MTDAVAVYAITENYLLPALVSAIQVRRFSSRELLDVLIVCIGEQTINGRKSAEVAARHGVEVAYFPVSVLENRPPHYARLILDKILPAKYSRVIYIDGDTQAAGALDPLVTATLPAGKFMAVRDPGQFFSRLSPKWRALIESDFKGGGYDHGLDAYFNSGVLVINRDGWSDIAARALSLYDADHPPRHLDQDLLNRAASDRCIRISNRWNFPGFLVGSPMERSVKPVIYHFMAHPRPWDYAVPPWGRKWAEPYDRLLSDNPELGFLVPKRRITKYLKHLLHQNYKQITEFSRVGRMTELPPDLEV